jgi:hypothetical protein
LQTRRLLERESQKFNPLVLQRLLLHQRAKAPFQQLNFRNRFLVHLLSIFLSLKHRHELVVGLDQRLEQRLHRIESLMEGSNGASVIRISGLRRVCSNALVGVIGQEVGASLVAVVALSVGIPSLARLNCHVLVAEAAHPRLSSVSGLDERGSGVLVILLSLVLLLLVDLLSGLPRVGDLNGGGLLRNETKLVGGLVEVSRSSIGDEVGHFGFFFFLRRCRVRFS